MSIDVKKKLGEPLRRMSSESGKAMKEMSNSLKKMTKPSSCDLHVQNARTACKSLTNLLNSGILKEVEPLELISLLTATSLLIDIINLTEKILESLYELASAAKFKNKIEPPLFSEKTNAKSIVCVRPIKCYDDHVVTIIEDDGNNDDTSKYDYRSKEVSIHEKHEDDTHVHAICVSCGHTCLCDVVECR